MTPSSIVRLLAQALQDGAGGHALRAETGADFAFVCALYAEVRHDELAPVPWPDQAKRDFLDAQCRLQRDHYAKHYVGAEFLIIERDARSIGRLYVHATGKEIRLMDIALCSTERNRGLGSRLVHALRDEAARRGVDLTLHVEPTNPAQHLYQRLGFRLIENRGVYDFLGWSAQAADQLNTASN